jgi:AcrR family transcriptional regulator
MVSNQRNGELGVGRQTLSREVVDRHKRDRVVVAASTLTHEIGPRALTVTLLTKRAKMARNTFYDLFEDRGDALSYAMKTGNAKLGRAVDEGAAGAGEWLLILRLTMDRLLDAVAADPHLAELCLLHSRTIEGDASPYDPELVQAIAKVVRFGRREGAAPGPGPRTEELIAYGVLSVIAERLRRGDLESLRGLGGEFSDLASRPFITRESLRVAD